MDVKSSFIPHLASIHAGPFYELEKHILDNQIKIESWFRDVWHQFPPILTSSVDIRNAGFKISAVDSNLFPAGFNNLNPDFFPLCIQAASNVLNEKYPTCKNILIIPENHTRNPFYYQSVATLQNILQKAGYMVKVGSLLENKTCKKVKISSEETLTLHPIERKDDKIAIKDFIPCLILLNNDLSEGIPPLLEKLKQPIEPHPLLGWSFRSKTTHFTYYQEFCEQFSKIIDIDPWQICPLFAGCTNVDFVNREGMDIIIEKTDNILSQIQQKYNQYNIEFNPFVFIKADAGTYGMAVMPIHSSEEISKLNRKQRTSMSVRKGGHKVNSVIIQEGIPTFETIGLQQSVAEPVVYLLGQHVVGGFYRVHTARGIYENLNSPGMHFEKLAFAECCNNPDSRLSAHDAKNQFYVYSVISRLSLLAASKELMTLNLSSSSMKG